MNITPRLLPFETSFWSLTFLVFGGALILAIYRRWWHPLRDFPGPPLASVSGLWEIWQEIPRQGSFTHAIQNLHQAYNSNVIRISPNHLHINDLNFFYEVFRVNSDFLKPSHFYERLQAPGSLATATNPNEHRILRRRVGPLFSSKATEKMAYSVELKARQAAENSAAFIEKCSAFNTQTLFRSIALDILCSEYFGGSVDFIENLEDASNLWAALDTIVRQTWEIQVARIPYLTKFAFGLPDWLVRSLVPDYVKFKQRCAIFLDQSSRQRRPQRYEHSGSHITFFDLLKEPFPSQKGFSLSRENLVGQAIGLVIAGVDTTSLSLTTAFYNILSSPEVESCLVAELEDARPLIRNGLEFHEIQKLPYLTAVIKESLRILPPLPGRIPRTVPPQGTFYNKIFIPGGTTISFSHYMIQNDHSIFPQPHIFKPERWLGNNRGELEKALVAFSKGTRSCPGKQLAYLEMYTILAIFFSRFKLQLDSPKPGEKLAWRDYFVADLQTKVEIRVIMDHWSE